MPEPSLAVPPLETGPAALGTAPGTEVATTIGAAMATTTMATAITATTMVSMAASLASLVLGLGRLPLLRLKWWLLPLLQRLLLRLVPLLLRLRLQLRP